MVSNVYCIEIGASTTEKTKENKHGWHFCGGTATFNPKINADENSTKSKVCINLSNPVFFRACVCVENEERFLALINDTLSLTAYI